MRGSIVPAGRRRPPRRHLAAPSGRTTPMTRRPRPPLSPEAAALVRAEVSRRAALAGAGALGIGALLAACGTSGTPTSSGASSSGDAGPKPAADRSDADKRVDWANWTLYL